MHNTITKLTLMLKLKKKGFWFYGGKMGFMSKV